MDFSLNLQPSLIRKYDVPGPRYTSYPTVPFWDPQSFSREAWEAQIRSIDPKEGISLYIHLPFCESLCTYCGCTTRITKNHAVEGPYLKALLQEWELYKQLLGRQPVIRELHLGGGTPTFFSPEHLYQLVHGLFGEAPDSREVTMSFEAHPGKTTEEHLRMLHGLGFRRVSFGIQDFDPEVQRTIHRIQTYQEVKTVTELARQIGYESINYDLIYGLPRQTLQSVEDTIATTLMLKPDRIAFYSYAHVPWMKPAQRSFESLLPDATVKRRMYESGKAMLTEAGYTEIGMDHFALPADGLYRAMMDGSLHRNFMGYTTVQTHRLIGLGVSAIGDLWGAFAQNVKSVEEYYQLLETNRLPVFRGHILTAQDLTIRRHILELMCQGQTHIAEQVDFFSEPSLRQLMEMLNDDLIEWKDDVLRITEKGRPFIRNVCMAFDARLLQKQPETPFFSRTI